MLLHQLGAHAEVGGQLLLLQAEMVAHLGHEGIGGDGLAGHGAYLIFIFCQNRVQKCTLFIIFTIVGYTRRLLGWGRGREYGPIPLPLLTSRFTPMKHLFVSAILAIALLLPLLGSAPAPAQTNSASLTALYDQYWDERAKLFPLEATAQGDNRYNDQLPNDQTQAFRDRLRRVLQRTCGRSAVRPRQAARTTGSATTSSATSCSCAWPGCSCNTWMMPFTQFGRPAH